MNRKYQALILGIMCVILTIAICVQIKTVNNNGSVLLSPLYVVASSSYVILKEAISILLKD